MHIDLSFGLSGEYAGSDRGTCAGAAAHGAAAASLPCTHYDISTVDDLNEIHIGALREYRGILDIAAVVFDIQQVAVINECNGMRNPRIYARDVKELAV